MTTSSHSFTRRALLSSGSVAAGIAATPALAKVAARAARPTAFRQTIDGFAEEVLQLSPETATSLGVDTGARAGLRAKLSDGSEAGNARFAAAAASMMTRLRKVEGRLGRARAKTR